MKLVTPLSFILAFFSIACQATELIWISNENIGRPFNADPVKGSESLSHILVEHLEGIDLVNIQSGDRRALKLLKELPNACTGRKLINKERAAKYHTSLLPHILFPAPRLYSHKPLAVKEPVIKNINFLNGAISGLTLGINKDRLFTEEVMALLNKLEPTNVYEYSGATSAATVISLFSRGRVSLVLEYPNVFKHFSSADPSGGLYKTYVYRVLPNGYFTRGHIVCAKSEQGKKLINALDLAIEKASKTKVYFNTHLKYIPKEEHDAFAALYNSLYKTNFSIH